MIELSKLSTKYSVCVLTEADTDDILALCLGNTLYYRYCEAQPTKEQILNDLRITPPGADLSKKHYVGFRRDGELIAVLDLIDGFPDPETAYIGFFMMNIRYQGKQAGTKIIRELAEYLKEAGYTAIRLGIDKGNPQSTHFWKKNGFAVYKEVERDGGTLLAAEKKL